MADSNSPSLTELRAAFRHPSHTVIEQEGGLLEPLSVRILFEDVLEKRDSLKEKLPSKEDGWLLVQLEDGLGVIGHRRQRSWFYFGMQVGAALALGTPIDYREMMEAAAARVDQDEFEDDLIDDRTPCPECEAYTQEWRDRRDRMGVHGLIDWLKQRPREEFGQIPLNILFELLSREELEGLFRHFGFGGGTIGLLGGGDNE